MKLKAGPGALVTAAFIGPGTLTVCTLAGVGFGYELIWVLVFATFSTIVLQEMSARLGVVTEGGLGEALRSELAHPILRVLSLGLVFIAIVIGNAAYEMGNVTGAVLGMENNTFDYFFWGPLIIGGLVALLLWKENFKLIQRIMAILVVIMSGVFVTTAVMIGSFEQLLQGMVPQLTSQNQLMALGLIGTTIVPYNLFLHSSAAARTNTSIVEIRIETLVTIALGGLISICVLVSATTGLSNEMSGISDMSESLEPLLGSWAKPFISIGIFAAGISSSLTAPFAAAITAKGIFGWSDRWKGRLVWGSILFLGVSLSMMGFKPVSVIQIAQVANGILLPIIVVFLIAMCNKKGLMGQYRNGIFQNTLAGTILLVSLIISFRSFNSVFHFT